MALFETHAQWTPPSLVHRSGWYQWTSWKQELLPSLENEPSFFSKKNRWGTLSFSGKDFAPRSPFPDSGIVGGNPWRTGNTEHSTVVLTTPTLTTNVRCPGHPLVPWAPSPSVSPSPFLKIKKSTYQNIYLYI